MEGLRVENRVSKESLPVWLAKVVITCYFTCVSYYLGHALNQPIGFNFTLTLETLKHVLNSTCTRVKSTNGNGEFNDCITTFYVCSEFDEENRANLTHT